LINSPSKRNRYTSKKKEKQERKTSPDGMLLVLANWKFADAVIRKSMGQYVQNAGIFAAAGEEEMNSESRVEVERVELNLKEWTKSLQMKHFSINKTFL
jgi:hypothetical protein